MRTTSWRGRGIGLRIEGYRRRSGRLRRSRSRRRGRRSGGDWTPKDQRELDVLEADDPQATSCRLSYMLDKPCYLVRPHRSSPRLLTFSQVAQHCSIPPSRIPAHVSAPTKRAHNFPIGKSSGYLPCAHEGACVPCDPCEPAFDCKLPTHCICSANGTLCDHYCGCSDRCASFFRTFPDIGLMREAGESRWKGCNCTPEADGACVRCPCAKASRECDPLFCHCLASTFFRSFGNRDRAD